MKNMSTPDPNLFKVAAVTIQTVFAKRHSAEALNVRLRTGTIPWRKSSDLKNVMCASYRLVETPLLPFFVDQAFALLSQVVCGRET
jgi:hypothetical protein